MARIEICLGEANNRMWKSDAMAEFRAIPKKFWYHIKMEIKK